MEEKTYTIQNKKVQKDSTIEITGEIHADTLEKHKKQVLKEVRENFEAPGFRKGHAPENVVEEQVPASHVLEQAAHRALEEAYPSIVQEEKLEVLSAPSFSVTKLAPGNPLGFVLTVGLFPKVKLPNYKSVAKSIYKSAAIEDVTEQEMKDTINQLLTMRAMNLPQDENKKPELPELTDDFVKTLGDFKDVSDFKKKLKENMQVEKNNIERRKLRERLAHELVLKANCPLSSLTIQSELSLAKARFENDIKKQNLTKEEYFEKTKQKEEDFWKKQEEYIEEHLKTKIILKEISKAEELKADEKLVQTEIMRLKQNFPDQNDAALKNYVTEALVNDAVLNFLEKEGGFKEPQQEEGKK